MRPVSVRIMHPQPGAHAGPIECWVADRRAGLAERHRQAFADLGAADVAIVAGTPDGLTFGARVRDLVDAERPAGLIVLGSGAIPLATAADLLAFVEAAGDKRRVALTNNRYSADIVAVAHAGALSDLPDLPSDNALPRWLVEVAGYEVRDLRHRWRLGIDVDGPLELVLLGGSGHAAGRPDLNLDRLASRIQAVRAVATDRRAELLIAGRTSASTLAWLERTTAARIRALVEERGLRAASRLAQATDGASVAGASSGPEAAPSSRQRPPASVLGALLDRDGPASLPQHLARFADAALVDSRVLLAHRLGPDESAWPAAEDRFASDLLLPDRVADPWLAELTAAAAAAPMPVLLGGHSLVGPGVRLLLGPRPPRQWT
jgi:hypothetical protein